MFIEIQLAVLSFCIPIYIYIYIYIYLYIYMYLVAGFTGPVKVDLSVMADLYANAPSLSC